MSNWIELNWIEFNCVADLCWVDLIWFELNEKWLYLFWFNFNFNLILFDKNWHNWFRPFHLELRIWDFVKSPYGAENTWIFTEQLKNSEIEFWKDRAVFRKLEFWVLSSGNFRIRRTQNSCRKGRSLMKKSLYTFWLECAIFVTIIYDKYINYYFRQTCEGNSADTIVPFLLMIWNKLSSGCLTLNTHHIKNNKRLILLVC